MTHMPKVETTQVQPIHPATEIGQVTLKVADLPRSIAFYTDSIGLTVFQQDSTSANLGAGKRLILRLEAVPGARPQRTNTTGLYHAAILLPNRRALAIKIAQLAAQQIQLGQGDHLVSEAFYLSDPDGNGLELYRDRPRAGWNYDNGRVIMAADAINIDNLFAEIGDEGALRDPVLPDGTQLGHMHLRVGDTVAAERFYHGVLGFDVTALWAGAVFVSAGGYHHHIGLNNWQSRGGKAPVEPSAGLRTFSIVLPDQAELDRLTRQVEAAGIEVKRADGVVTLNDPWNNLITLALPTSLVTA